MAAAPTLWPPMMGDPPNSVFLCTHVSQLEGPPSRLCHTAPLFCHTEMAVPAWKGASGAGALRGRCRSCGSGTFPMRLWYFVHLLVTEPCHRAHSANMLFLMFSLGRCSCNSNMIKVAILSN